MCWVGAAVCQFSTSGDDYGYFAFVSGWGAAGAFGGTKVSRAVRFDWRGFADGNCDEKFDFVGGLPRKLGLKPRPSRTVLIFTKCEKLLNIQTLQAKKFVKVIDYSHDNPRV